MRQEDGRTIGDCVIRRIAKTFENDDFVWMGNKDTPDSIFGGRGRILEGRAGIGEVADEVLDVVRATAAGCLTASERLGHREFVLTYKSSEPAGPACLPMAR